ncbi:WD40-repeat-containing domain protein [Coniella lustricola]|uniref:Mitochondrial division protein 1 n=1 Tax=Coniella lustricola TaxID=2025994 RepID=A0A2T3AMM2_9PEZI|nr:WD40-repeat-containing domain protein [Coniella lustricola]
MDSGAELEVSSSKRRKRNDGSAEQSSAEERDPSPHVANPDTRALSIRRPPQEPSSRSRSRSANSDSRTRQPRGPYYSSRSQSTTRSRSRSNRARSASGSLSRSRSRARSRSPSQSDDAGSRSPSPSRSRSRSRSRTSSTSHRTRRHSTSPSRDRNRANEENKPLRPDFRPHLELCGHAKPISQVRISPDGRWIASASADGTAMLWDAETGAHMDTLVGHMAGLSCLAWSPDSETIATGSDDKAIRLWNRTTGDPAHAAGADENLPPGERIGTSARGIGGRTDGGVRGTGGRKPLLGHHNYIYCLKFSPKGNMLASGGYDEAVFLWDVRAGRLMRSLPAHSDPVSGIDFCMDGTLVASCSTDGLIRIWDTSTGQCLRTLVYEDNPAAASVCFSPNGRFILASYTDSCMRLWDFINMPCTVKKTYQGHVNKNYSVGGCFGLLRLMRKVLVVSSLPGGGSNANGDSNENDDENENENDFAEEQWEEADSVAFVASASEDGNIMLWDVKSKEILQRIEGAHRGVCFWVDVHGETGTMVSCGQDGRIVVFKHRYLSKQTHSDADKIGTNGRGKNVTANDLIEENTSDGDDGQRYPQMSEDLVIADENHTMLPGNAAEEKGHSEGDRSADDQCSPQTNGHTFHNDAEEARTPADNEQERVDLSLASELLTGGDVEMEDWLQ